MPLHAGVFFGSPPSVPIVDGLPGTRLINSTYKICSEDSLSVEHCADRYKSGGVGGDVGVTAKGKSRGLSHFGTQFIEKRAMCVSHCNTRPAMKRVTGAE